MHFVDKLIENHKILPESLPQLKMTNENTLNLVEVEFVYIICIGDLKITPKHKQEECNFRKSPVTVVLLACSVSGLGQVYAGDLYRELALFAALGFSLYLIFIGIITFFATLIFAVTDAYKMIQNGEIKETNEVSV